MRVKSGVREYTLDSGEKLSEWFHKTANDNCQSYRYYELLFFTIGKFNRL